MEKLLTVAETAAAIGVTPMTVGRWIKAGKITTTKIGTRYFVAATEAERLTAPHSQAKVADSQLINAAVERAVAEYGETLKRLGKE